jgi:hypothetical protein
MSHLVARLLDGSDEIDVDCLHCRWHDYLHKENHADNLGICRKNPPTFVDGRKKSFWPFVHHDDYCGGFELDTKHPYEIHPDKNFEVFRFGDN